MKIIDRWKRMSREDRKTCISMAILGFTLATTVLPMVYFTVQAVIG